MTSAMVDRLILAVLAVDGFVVAVLEVLYLPTYLGGAQFPISILVAAVVNVALVLVTTRITQRGVLVLAPLLAWVLGLVVCMMQVPGGSIVLTQTEHTRTLLLLLMGLGPAVLTAAYRRRTTA